MTNAFKMTCLPEQKSACLDAALAPVQVALIKQKGDSRGYWAVTLHGTLVSKRIESKESCFAEHKIQLK